MPVIYGEVDWDAKFREPQFGEVSSLRFDPRRNSTTTIHLAGQRGELDRDGKPVAGQRTFFMGPAERVVGGQLTYAYPERATGKVVLDKSLDPAEILKQYKSTMRTGTTSPGATGRLETDAGGRAHTAPAAPVKSVGRMGKKLVYWDGLNHHVVDAPPGYTGPISIDKKSATGWTPPHLQHKDVEPGRFLGVVEMPGASDTKLVGSKHRVMPDFSPGGHQGSGRIGPFHHEPGSGGSLAGLSQENLARRSLANSVRAYGLTHKPIGYKEYEGTCRQLEGLNRWEGTQSHLSSSMLVGKPSRLLGPFEHTATRLSLRRPPHESSLDNTTNSF